MESSGLLQSRKSSYRSLLSRRDLVPSGHATNWLLLPKWRMPALMYWNTDLTSNEGWLNSNRIRTRSTFTNIFFIFKELLNKDVALLFDIKRERGLIFNGGVQRWSTPTFNERLDNSLVYINKAVVTCAGLYHGIENVHPFREEEEGHIC